jgi:chemotaxis protein MotB
VVKYFIEEMEVGPERLSAAGYSKYKPLYPNDTPEHRSMNRRVDVILKNQSEEEEEDLINE